MNGNQVPWWTRESAWRKLSIWITAVMLVVLIVLTFDSVPQISAGSKRVPDYDVINRRIYYRYDEQRHKMAPVIGAEAPLFGKKLSAVEAQALVDHGKLTVQGRNCMSCHTFLGNGAYYAPDLTKAWLDPGWAAEPVREELMLNFLKDPAANARGFGTTRRMPHLELTDDEAHGVIAYLKWMSAIDTNGFPARFTPIAQEGDQ